MFNLLLKNLSCLSFLLSFLLVGLLSCELSTLPPMDFSSSIPDPAVLAVNLNKPADGKMTGSKSV